MGKEMEQTATPQAEETLRFENLKNLAQSYYMTSIILVDKDSAKGKVTETIEFEPKSLDAEGMVATIYVTENGEKKQVGKKEVSREFDMEAFEVMKKMYNGKDGMTVDIEMRERKSESGTYPVWCAVVTMTI